jgi:hypothetical protein
MRQETRDFGKETRDFMKETHDFVKETRDFMKETRDFVNETNHAQSEVQPKNDLGLGGSRPHDASKSVGKSVGPFL